METSDNYYCLSRYNDFLVSAMFLSQSIQQTIIEFKKQGKTKIFPQQKCNDYIEKSSKIVFEFKVIGWLWFVITGPNTGSRLRLV